MKPCPTLAARGDRYTAAPWRPNPLPSPRNDPNESGRTMIACRESATKIRTNLPWYRAVCAVGYFARHGHTRRQLYERLEGSTKIRCARLTGERQGVRVPRNEGVTNHVSPRAVRRSSRGVRRSVGSGSCGRAVEHRKGTCPGCRGFRIGRRQHRWPRYGERSASPAVSENPCTHESLSSGPGRPPPHLALSAGVAKGRQNCRSRRRTGRRSQTRS